MTSTPERIELFLRQQLSDQEQAAFELHLDECNDCRRRLKVTAAGDDIWSGVREALISAPQRFYEGPIAFSFPLLFSGVADVCEWYDDQTERFQIEVKITNRTWGRLFGYRGAFDVAYQSVRSEEIPNHVRPLREEFRE